MDDRTEGAQPTAGEVRSSERRCERCEAYVADGEHFSDPRCNIYGIGVVLCRECAEFVAPLNDELFARGGWTAAVVMHGQSRRSFFVAPPKQVSVREALLADADIKRRVHEYVKARGARRVVAVSRDASENEVRNANRFEDDKARELAGWLVVVVLGITDDVVPSTKDGAA